MNITVNGKNIIITEGLRDAVERKLTKLEKYFSPSVEANTTLSVQKNRQIVEVTIPFNGVILRAEEDNDDMYAAIDLVLEKLEKQIRKQKTKLERRKYGDSLRYQLIPEYNLNSDEEEFKIVKTKRFPVKPMNEEEAILQMELLGHNFFVYTNADTNEINVVYKRKDGKYGLIEPEY
ncbi:putative sigma-54 modulation protein [Clostridium homopropionicum DSM 5847]|uniref:Ribosome hibernation promoting factor n=1 Tax=Clostridium homopropionicum DSM 5847 TaxID=1121318 RepID=A0A0L6Z5U7_9CLOT|nr:ribosome-associated translation inhibitor RaiA [Clostridium homopropionicum]KOA18340.1 putative sigma-54 modulation protein [Clostridium homopropionicum DSM 5847]SFF68885.1 SSU ribosomal protein S30P /sigma 54 modulation protein [Clostridium homopropionicum]